MDDSKKVVAGTYEILSSLGSGGGGRVYLARHRRLDKKVVLKADKRKISTREEFLRKEVDVLKELDIRHIPRVYDYFVENGIAYTVMDYIEGESFDHPLERGEVFTQAQVIFWACQLLEALRELHAPVHGNPPRGYVHSDIKPANLMRTPQNEICLIDFNVSLALGETQVIGKSAGYASPEHYGLDFSTGGSLTHAQGEEDRTEVIVGGTRSLKESRREQPLSQGGVSEATDTGKKIIIPDVRSDIYSTGATLYHLLSGKRPVRDATQVEPLSRQDFSSGVVDIITRAMTPNPDLRYQSAGEMLEALRGLRTNDPRMKAWKRGRTAACILFPVLFAGGVGLSFVGLKRMQTTEKWLKLAEYASSALDDGDVGTAIVSVMQAFPEKKTVFTPTEPAEAKRVLTEALGVYDLSGSYKASGVVELPSELLGLELSPDEKTALCRYSGHVAVVDTDSMEVLRTLTLDPSALAEAKYLDSERIVYAGVGGICCEKLSSGEMIWTGEPATSICISGDGQKIAAVYKDANRAVIYDGETGDILDIVDFGNKAQDVTVNDTYADPENNLFCISDDGKYLALSFQDGTLWLVDLESQNKAYTLLDETSGFFHFECGFYGQYLAFSASSKENSAVVVWDTGTMEQTGGFGTVDSTYSVQADDKGIFIRSDNILVKIDPVTGEQTAMVTTAENIGCFSTDGTHTLITTDQKALFYDDAAIQIGSCKNTGSQNYVKLEENLAAIGSLDSKTVRFLNYEDYPETQILTYNPDWEHSEVRISADEQTVMLFSYKRFQIYEMDGELLVDLEIPDAEQVYDQQYIREDGGSVLEVFYNDGTVKRYDGGTGDFLEEEKQEKPDNSLSEEFETADYRVESPLHGSPAVYEKKSGRLIKKLAEEAYLTYVTETESGYVLQYMTADGVFYGQLLDENWEIIADLPYLCDVKDEMLYFDYPSGNVCRSHIWNIEEIKEKAREREEQ